MSTQPTLKFLGAAIVAAAFSTGTLAQTSATPGSNPANGAPTSGAMSNSNGDSGASSTHKGMRKHKAEKDNSSKANPNAQELKDGPMGTSPGGGNSGGGAGGASGSAGR